MKYILFGVKNLFPLFPSPSIPNFVMVTSFNELSVSHVQKSLHSFKSLIKWLQDVATLLGMQTCRLPLIHLLKSKPINMNF